MTEEFSYKIYDAINIAKTSDGKIIQATVYLGKASVAGVNGASNTFFSNLSSENQCSSTFIFGSLVGGRNLSITPATATDPYVYLDGRWYDFKASGYNSTYIPANNILSNIEIDSELGKITLYLKNITSDGSLLFESPSQVVTEETEASISPYNESNYADIILKAHRYDCANVCGPTGLFAGRKGIPGKSDTIFVFKTIFGGRCIKVDYNDDFITINYDVSGSNCVPGSYNGGSLPVAYPSAGSCDAYGFSTVSQTQSWRFVSNPLIDSICPSSDNSIFSY
jgi:hypothetical protein